MRAEGTFKIRDISGDALAENFDRELKSFKLRVRVAFALQLVRLLIFSCRYQRV